jgi:hypothetical protein
MKCEFCSKSTHREHNQAKGCSISKHFFEYDDDKYPVQTAYIPFRNITSKCSKCSQRDCNTLKIEVTEKNYVCCNCQNDLGFKDKMNIKTSATSSLVKIQHRVKVQDWQIKNERSRANDKDVSIFGFLRNSHDQFKTLENSNFVRELKIVSNSSIISPMVCKKIRKTQRKSVRQPEPVLESELDIGKKPYFSKYNPFEKLKRSNNENCVVVSNSQTIDWQNFSLIYHKTKEEFLTKLQENLKSCCKTLWNDIDSSNHKNLNFVVDFDKMKLDLSQYLKIGVRINGNPYLFLCTVDDASVSDNYEGSKVNVDSSRGLSIDEFICLSEPELSYLTELSNKIKTETQKLEYINFLKEFSISNRERTNDIFKNLTENSQNILNSDRRVKRDEKQMIKNANFLSFMKFIKKFKTLFGKYSKVQEELSVYLNYINNHKANNCKSEDQSKDNYPHNDSKLGFQNHARINNPVISNSVSHNIHLKIGDMLEDSFVSPHGFGGLIHHKSDENTQLKIAKQNSFVPFQPISPNTSIKNSSANQNPENEIASEGIEIEIDNLEDNVKEKGEQDKNRENDQKISECQKSEQEIESDCAVCFSPENSFTHPVIYCSGCEQGVHLACMNLREIPSENYYCVSCQFKNDDRSPSCYICKNKGFMLLQVVGDNSFAYHMFCVFATKSWNEIYDSQKCTKLKTKCKSRCLYCDKLNLKNSKMLKCSQCKSVTFHSLCAFFNGLYFGIEFDSEITFDNFIAKQYDYSANVYCEHCTVERLSSNQQPISNGRSLLDIIYMNGYLRLICIWPYFYKSVPTFERYKTLRSGDHKFWLRISNK